MAGNPFSLTPTLSPREREEWRGTSAGGEKIRDYKNQSSNKLYNTADISVHAELRACRAVEAWPYLTLRLLDRLAAQGERL